MYYMKSRLVFFINEERAAPGKEGGGPQRRTHEVVQAVSEIAWSGILEVAAFSLCPPRSVSGKV